MVKPELHKYYGMMEKCLNVMTETFLKEEEF
jgi:hypothetical protein